MGLLILLFAPVLQITLSALRITGRLNLKLGIVALLCFGLGITMCFASMKMVLDQLAQQGYRCGMPALGAFILGLIITVVTVPVIWLICHLTCRQKNKQAKPESLVL